MSQQLEKASRQLLSPTGIDRRDIEKTLDQMIVNDIDYADLYFEYSQAESWVLEEGIIREGAHSIDQGVGVRAVSGDKSGFAYSDEIILPALTDAAKAARTIARSGGTQTLQACKTAISLRYIPATTRSTRYHQATRSRCCNGSMPKPVTGTPG